MLETKVREATELSRKIRIAELEMFAHLGFGHIGGALSVTDLFAVLYSCVMNYKSKDPAWSERDRLVVSKGHAGPALYATLALEGFFPYEDLFTLNQGGTNLPSHCDKNKTIGIDMTTGSLGQGFSLAIGMALALKKKPKVHVYAVVGDGECQEGQVWEGAMFAHQQQLHNLILFVDKNNKQLDGYTKEINDLDNLEAKFTAFGWNTFSCDGNNIRNLIETIEEAKDFESNNPTVIVMNTLKGKGARFVEQTMANHHMVINKERCFRCN